MGPSEEEESRIKSRDPFEGYRGVLDVLHVRYKSPKQLSAEIFGRNKSCHMMRVLHACNACIACDALKLCVLCVYNAETKHRLRRLYQIRMQFF